MNASATASYEQGLRLSKQGRLAQAIDCYQAALAFAPSDPRILFALGNTARALDMRKPAEMFFRQVLALEPERLEALINLANLLTANGDAVAARDLLAPALRRNPNAPELWLTLGSAHRACDDAEAAIEHYRRALDLKPNYAAALANLADMISQQGETAEALSLYDRALRAEPENAQAKLNRAIQLFLTGELKQGWRDYAARLKIAGKAPITDHRLPSWTGASLKNKRLLVTAEQGVGDELMFASVIPSLAARAAEDGGSVVLECDARLVSLFARSFLDVAVHPAQRETREGRVFAHYGWLKQAGGANLAIEIGSLPRYLRNDIASFDSQSYLDPDEIEVLDWQSAFSRVGEAPFIGVCWRSGKMTDGRARNFAPIELWANLLRALPGTPVCLQYDATPEEVEKLGALSGKSVIVPDSIDQKNELDRVAALLSALDVVICAPTAVSWLAAGVGVPTFKLLRDKGWTSFATGAEPFAPAARCIVPEHPGDWADCIAKAKVEISRRL
jgi:tetratricopeptide (TPR) repeat protein